MWRRSASSWPRGRRISGKSTVYKGQFVFVLKANCVLFLGRDAEEADVEKRAYSKVNSVQGATCVLLLTLNP